MTLPRDAAAQAAQAGHAGSRAEALDPLCLDALLPPDVLVRALPVRDRMAELIGDEAQPIRDAVPTRQAAYSTGRVLARALLAECGATPGPLLRRPDSRLPDWPEGFVGSITHSGTLCLAAVAPGARYGGLGIDLEPDQPTRRAIERHVLREAERAWVDAAASDEGERRRWTRLFFSAKEAVYKAFHPVVGRVWTFLEVGLELDLASGRFRAELPADAGRATVEGGIVRREGWIVSGVVWPRAAG